MQIFQPHSCAIKCAQSLDNKRVIKMMTESAQILSTAAHIRYYHAVPYKMYQPKRKLIQWAASSKANYAWLILHFQSLVREYQLRYPNGGMKGKHAHPYVKSFVEALEFMPDGELTTHVFDSTAILPKVVEELSVHTAYKALLMLKWMVQDKRPPMYYRDNIDTKKAMALLELTEAEYTLIMSKAVDIGIHRVEYYHKTKEIAQ